MIHVISLGAGVQSTTMALMAAHGEITPMPDCAIFADTGWEPRAVYAHLRWLVGELPFPVHVVSNGNIRQKIVGDFSAGIPWHLVKPDGAQTVGSRQCTNNFKLKPIARKVVELLGGRPKGGATMWIGISLDEAIRMKPARVQYMVHRWPLIELAMSRQGCLAWLDKRGFPLPPKSSCVGCPLHNYEHWRALPDFEIEDAIEIDRLIRHQPGARGVQFMHRSGRPLEEVDLSTAEDRGQLNLFLNECEGMCGV